MLLNKRGVHVKRTKTMKAISYWTNFQRAVLDGLAHEPRLRLQDNRDQILVLRGTLAGYRGQSPRATILAGSVLDNARQDG